MVSHALSRQQVSAALLDCLRFVAGDNSPNDFDERMVVLQEWDLDSEHGVEIACDLSARLGLAIPDKDNPLIEDDGTTKRKRARTFCEVVDYLLTLSKE